MARDIRVLDKHKICVKCCSKHRLRNEIRDCNGNLECYLKQHLKQQTELTIYEFASCNTSFSNTTVVQKFPVSLLHRFRNIYLFGYHVGLPLHKSLYQPNPIFIVGHCLSNGQLTKFNIESCARSIKMVIVVSVIGVLISWYRCRTLAVGGLNLSGPKLKM